MKPRWVAVRHDGASAPSRSRMIFAPVLAAALLPHQLQSRRWQPAPRMSASASPAARTEAATIIGAGPAGLATAIMLARRGVENAASMAGQREALPADCPRLVGARGSLGHALALREASGEPAGRRLSHVGFHT